MQSLPYTQFTNFEHFALSFQENPQKVSQAIASQEGKFTVDSVVFTLSWLNRSDEPTLTGGENTEPYLEIIKQHFHPETLGHYPSVSHENIGISLTKQEPIPQHTLTEHTLTEFSFPLEKMIEPKQLSTVVHEGEGTELIQQKAPVSSTSSLSNVKIESTEKTAQRSDKAAEAAIEYFVQLINDKVTEPEQAILLLKSTLQQQTEILKFSQEDTGQFLTKIRTFLHQEQLNTLTENVFGRITRLLLLTPDSLRQIIGIINDILSDLTTLPKGDKTITFVPIQCFGTIPEEISDVCSQVRNSFRYSSSVLSCQMPPNMESVPELVRHWVSPTVDNKHFLFKLLDENPTGKAHYLESLSKKSTFKNAFFADKFDIVDYAMRLAQEAGSQAILPLFLSFNSEEKLATLPKPILLFFYKMTKEDKTQHEWVNTLIDIQLGKVTATKTYVSQYQQMVKAFAREMQQEEHVLTFGEFASLIALMTRYGNCSSQSYLAGQRLLELGYRVQLLSFEKPGHIVLLVEEKGKKHGKVYIVDPWAGIVCEATATYFNRFYLPPEKACTSAEDLPFHRSFFVAHKKDFSPE